MKDNSIVDEMFREHPGPARLAE